MGAGTEVGTALGSGLGAALGAGVGAELGGPVGASVLGATFSALAAVAARSVTEAISREYEEGGDAWTVPAPPVPSHRPPDDLTPPVSRPEPPTTIAGMEMTFDELLDLYGGSLVEVGRACGLDMRPLSFYVEDLAMRGYGDEYIHAELHRLVRHQCEHRVLEDFQLQGMAAEPFRIGALTPGDVTVEDYLRDFPAYIEPMKNTTAPHQHAGIGQAYSILDNITPEWILDQPAPTGMPQGSLQPPPIRTQSEDIVIHEEPTEDFQEDFERRFRDELEATDTKGTPSKPGSGAMWAVVGVAGVAVLGTGTFIAYKEGVI